LVLDAPPGHFLTTSSRPAAGVAAVLAAAVAAAIVAVYARPWAHERETAGIFAAVDEWLAALADAQEAVRIAAGAAAALLTMYAAGLGVLELFVQVGTSLSSSFDWGHVAVTSLYAAVGLAAVVAGLRRDGRVLEPAAVAWLAVVLAKHCFYDFPQLAETQRSYASLAVAAAALAVAVVYQLLKRELKELHAIPVLAELVSATLAVLATIVLVGDHRIGGAREGAALLGLGAVYALTAAAVFRRQRDLSTLLWATGLTIAAGASFEVLSGTWLVLAWAVAAAAVAALADRVGEARLLIGSLALLVLGLGHALVLEAPPTDLFLSSRHPGAGLPALLLLAAATAVVGLFAEQSDEDELPIVASLGRYAPWAAGAIAVYAGSLGILEIAEAVGTASVRGDFQHGHTAVSAFWGVLGLTALYAGLRRRSRALRLGGFGLFGVSLAKLFLYDLAALSSITRALSFLAVGAVLLLGGFFYQRLSAELEDRPVG
jgi:hypothetical protein